MIQTIAQARVIDVHPLEKQISVSFRNLAQLSGVKVDVLQRDASRDDGDFLLPAKGSVGVVLFYTDDPRAGVWIGSVTEIGNHVFPSELLTDTPRARLEQLPGSSAIIKHQDGSLEQTYGDGTMLRVTTSKDGTVSNTNNRVTRTIRKRSQGAFGEKPNRVTLEQKALPVDVVLDHSSGANLTLTADGSILFRTAHGHTLRVFDSSEKARDADGNITSEPDPNRDNSAITIRTEGGLEFKLQDKTSDRYAQITTPNGTKFKISDGQAKLETPGGRTVTLDDAGNVTTIHDPVKVVIDAPSIEAGGGTPVALVGDSVTVVPVFNVFGVASIASATITGSGAAHLKG